MTFRGRGILEIKSSSNPFLQTVNSQLGADPNDTINWKHDVNPCNYLCYFLSIDLILEIIFL